MQQTILIAGASSGLGKRLCELYCSEGHRVAVAGRRVELLHELQRSYPELVVPFQLDISSPDCHWKVETIIEQLGGIDILIITASIVDFNPELRFEPEKNLFAINITGFAAVINAGYHYFSEKGSGQIVGVTSIAGARGNRTTPAYSASKAFQTSYLESIRLKLLSEKKKVTVTELIPGYMDTQMAKGDRLFWITDITKAARQAKAAIDQKRRRAFITRRWYYVYTIYKYLPSSIYTYLINSTIKLQKRN